MPLRRFAMGYLYIFATILLTVYGQVVIKWRVSLAGGEPPEAAAKVAYVLRLFLDPWVFSGLAAAVLAAGFWILAMSRLPLSFAYPFMSLAFVLVIVASGYFFSEPVTPLKIIGIALIVIGIAVGSRG